MIWKYLELSIAANLWLRGFFSLIFDQNYLPRSNDSHFFCEISDTVTDGRLDLMSHVGITIDLSHANMGFLKRKIQAKKAEMKEQERVRAEQEKIRNEKIMKITRASEQSNNKAKPAQVRFLVNITF